MPLRRSSTPRRTSPRGQTEAAKLALRITPVLPTGRKERKRRWVLQIPPPISHIGCDNRYFRTGRWARIQYMNIYFGFEIRFCGGCQNRRILASYEKILYTLEGSPEIGPGLIWELHTAEVAVQGARWEGFGGFGALGRRERETHRLLCENVARCFHAIIVLTEDN